MTTFNYNDYYKNRVLTNNTFSLLNTTGGLQQVVTSGGGVTTPVTSLGLYIGDVPTTGTRSVDYFPTVATSTGYVPLYMDDTKKPMTLTYNPQSTTWSSALKLTSIDFGGATVRSVADPTVSTDAVNKRYVDSHTGQNWWQYPALGPIDISSQVLQNAKIIYDDACADPVLTPDGVLVLNGNNTSRGRWEYRMSSDIERFEIFDMASNGEFTLILKGDPDYDRKINFCGNGTNYLYTSWRGPITIGKQTYVTFSIRNMTPDILMQMSSYN